MATTARLGSSDSNLSNIQLGKDSTFYPDNAGRPPYDTALAHLTLAGTGAFDPPRYQLVQSTGHVTNGGPVVMSFASPVTPGNLVVAFGFAVNNTTYSAVDNQSGNTYRLAQANANIGSGAGILYAYNVASNGGTFTVTLTGASHGTLQEYSGFGTTDPYISSNGRSKTNSATIDTQTASPANPDASALSVCCVTELSGGNINVVQTGFDPNYITDWMSSGSGIGVWYRYIKTSATQSANWTLSSGANTSSASIVVFDNRQDIAVSAAGTSTASAIGLAIFEGGDILLEDGTNLLLEDGTNALLESTADGGTAQADGTSTVSGVGAALVAGVGTAAGSSTAQAEGQDIGTVTGDGTETFAHITLAGSGQTGQQGSGSETFAPIALSGAGLWTNPTLLETQIAREDLEVSDVQRINETQFAIEDIEEYDLPIIQEAQFAVEDIEEYSSPRINLTQYCVEILIPFDCDLTPPLTLPPGCPPDEIEGTGSDGPGCEANDAQGTGSDDDGCTPTVRTS